MVQRRVRGALRAPYVGHQELYDFDAEFAGAACRADEEERLPGRDARADLAGRDDRHRADALLLHVDLLRDAHRADEQGAGRLALVPSALRREGRPQGRGARTQGENRVADQHFQTDQILMRRCG